MGLKKNTLPKVGYTYSYLSRFNNEFNNEIVVHVDALKVYLIYADNKPHLFINGGIEYDYVTSIAYFQTQYTPTLDTLYKLQLEELLQEK